MVTLSILRVDYNSSIAARTTGTPVVYYRGIVYNDKNVIVDVLENTDANAMLDNLFDAHDISAVRMADGSLDAGDELSVREVADIFILSLS